MTESMVMEIIFMVLVPISPKPWWCSKCR